MKAIKSLLYALCSLGVFLQACSPSVQTTDELERYVADLDNELAREKTVDPVSIRVSYRPTALLVQQSLSDTPTTAEVDSLYKNFGKYEYFTLSLSANGKEIETYALNTRFKERIQTLAFGMGEYLHLVTDTRDTVPLADYFYQRTYGIGKSSDFLLAFEGERLRKARSFQLYLDDFGLGIGVQRFQFETRHLLDVPTIENQFQ